MNLRATIAALLFGAITAALCTPACAQRIGKAAPAAAKDEAAATVRCAVIGGMGDTGFWPALSNRFQKSTGIQIEIVATGPKQEIVEVFRAGEADVITMHTCDTIINLVADGVAENPQPWARNDMVLVGPPDDPAKIRGTADAVAALGKIIKTKSKLLLHQSLGANEVLHDLLTSGRIELDAEATVVMPSDRHRQLLARAAREHAYTLVGRIPFLNGKIRNPGLEIMSQGDPRLRRPYLVVVRTASGTETPRHQAACRLARFLREPETQQWISGFGRGKLDDRPLFFPVVVPPGESK
ncbi:MAG TPA: substrate-binding domain-containing protein [Pirellulales bacterium]|nr:substrate-binding domain-containing protein [Pirellulales bacterium]